MRAFAFVSAWWAAHFAWARRVQTEHEQLQRLPSKAFAELLFAPVGATGGRVAGHDSLERLPHLQTQASSGEGSVHARQRLEVAMRGGSDEVVKERLKSEIADGLANPQLNKAAIGEILLTLEGQNPTATPATSPLLNGKWKLVYASGASPGQKAFQLLLQGSMLAPKSPSGADMIDVGDVHITISPGQPRATSELNLRLLSFENSIKLASKLEVESSALLIETYDSAQSEYGNLRLPFASPLEYKRSILVSYLDDELLVVRDEDGRPDVLMRVDAPFDDFRNTEEDVPGATS